jgi:hypothetical protein
LLVRKIRIFLQKGLDRPLAKQPDGQITPLFRARISPHQIADGWHFERQRRASPLCDVHVSQPLEMRTLKAGKGGAGHDELGTLECFSLKKIDEGLDDKIFLVLDGLARELARNVNNSKSWVVGLAIRAERQ